METRKDFSNKLLKRRELEIVFQDEKNPGFEKVKKEIVQKFKVSEENVVVRNVKNNFGNNEFIVDVFIYQDKAAKDFIEPRKKEKKKAGGVE